MKNLILIPCLFLALTPSLDADEEATSVPLIAVNQVGYNTQSPKRFTAPGTSDGAVFTICRFNSEEVLFTGSLLNGLGDFTRFQPADGESEFVIRIPSMGEESDPFSIRENLYQEQFWQPAMDFMIDCRSVVGTHPSAYGGCPWRDGTYYSYEVPSLLMLYAADPAFWEKAPKQIDWHAEQARVADPAFPFDANNRESDGVMEAVRRYYQELEAPFVDAPDALKLVHWGLGFYLMKPYTKDPSLDPLPKQIHSQTLEQFAHLVYWWKPLNLERWLPRSFYDDCLAFSRTHWEAVGSFDIDPLWDPESYPPPVNKEDGTVDVHPDLHPYKGRHVPGHSILPNLFMYTVLADIDPLAAERHLAAAQMQTQFIIDKLDWEDPRTTKGHRGSEFQTLLNLAWFQKNLPDHAPVGLREKIEDWIDVAISRSNNFWDFRRYDMNENWTVPSMNEPGNLAAFPAAALSAATVISDPEKKDRLRELATAQVDNLWGRNPRRAAATHRPEQGYPLVERGWPKGFRDDVCARLELCRGGIDASPGSEMYPNNPDGALRWPEGWINWNACWNVGLASFSLLSID